MIRGRIRPVIEIVFAEQLSERYEFGERLRAFEDRRRFADSHFSEDATVRQRLIADGHGIAFTILRYSSSLNARCVSVRTLPIAPTVSAH